MTHVNHQSPPLFSLPFQSKVDKYSNSRHSKKNYPVIAYLMSLPSIGFTVNVLRLAWRIIAFIFTVFSSKKVSKQRHLDRTHTIAIEQEAPSKMLVPIQESQLKDHFLTMASHELKTPMTTILGLVQLMLRRMSRMPELSSELAILRSALESIDGQARRLNVLVEDLLDLYNIRAGRAQLRLTSCNLVDICREAIKEQQSLTGRTIELEAPQKAVILQADADRLYQVVVNLLSNAIRYSPESSPIKLLAAQGRDIGIVEVFDSGQGISKEQQAHIFEPFYRGSDVQASSKSGLGLGLAICKDIVERHSGRIWCRSRAGKGSTFIVELPLNKTRNVTS